MLTRRPGVSKEPPLFHPSSWEEERTPSILTAHVMFKDARKSYAVLQQFFNVKRSRKKPLDGQNIEIAQDHVSLPL